MPSGAKKRKAAKKRMQKGGTRNHSDTTISNGDSTAVESRPQHENDDVKSFEERDSDPAEVVKQEVEEEVNGDGEVIEDTKEVGLQEETVVETIVDKMASAAETIPEEIKPEIASTTNVKDDNSAIKESLVEDLAIDNGVEVAAGEEEVVAKEKRELSGLNDVSDGAVKPAEYLPEEAIGLPPGASVDEVLDLIEERIVDDDSGKQVVNSTTESTPAEIVDAMESQLKVDTVGVPPEVQSAKDESAESSAIRQPEFKLVTPILDTKNGVDVVAEELKTQKLSDVKVDAPPVDPSTEAEVATVTSRETDDFKNLVVHGTSESQPIMSNSQPAIRGTSWKNCCGIFELCVGADR